MKKLLACVLMALVFVGSFSGVGVYASLTNCDNLQVVKLNENVTRTIAGDVIVDDEWTQEYRKITTYSGENIVVDYYDITTGIVTTSINGVVKETHNIENIRAAIAKSWSIPKDDLNVIIKFIEKKDSDKKSKNTFTEKENEIINKYNIETTDVGEIVIMPKELSDMSRSNRVSVNVLSSPTSAFPMYYDQLHASKNIYSNAVNYTLNMKIKDSRYNYVLLSSGYKDFDINTTLSYISIALSFAYNLVKSQLSAYTILLEVAVSTLVEAINTDIRYYTDKEYMYTLKRECTIYDYTYNYRDVTVVAEYGNGKFAIAYDIIGNNEYINPHWHAFGVPNSTTFSNNEYFSRTQELWEYNIQEFGHWKWGDLEATIE